MQYNLSYESNSAPGGSSSADPFPNPSDGVYHPDEEDPYSEYQPRSSACLDEPWSPNRQGGSTALRLAKPPTKRTKGGHTVVGPLPPGKTHPDKEWRKQNRRPPDEKAKWQNLSARQRAALRAVNLQTIEAHPGPAGRPPQRPLDFTIFATQEEVNYLIFLLETHVQHGNFQTTFQHRTTDTFHILLPMHDGRGGEEWCIPLHLYPLMLNRSAWMRELLREGIEPHPGPPKKDVITPCREWERCKRPGAHQHRMGALKGPEKRIVERSPKSEAGITTYEQCNNLYLSDCFRYVDDPKAGPQAPKIKKYVAHFHAKEGKDHALQDEEVKSQRSIRRELEEDELADQDLKDQLEQEDEGDQPKRTRTKKVYRPVQPRIVQKRAWEEKDDGSAAHAAVVDADDGKNPISESVKPLATDESRVARRERRRDEPPKQSVLRKIPNRPRPPPALAQDAEPPTHAASCRLLRLPFMSSSVGSLPAVGFAPLPIVTANGALVLPAPQSVALKTQTSTSTSTSVVVASVTATSTSTSISTTVAATVATTTTTATSSQTLVVTGPAAAPSASSVPPAQPPQAPVVPPPAPLLPPQNVAPQPPKMAPAAMSRVRWLPILGPVPEVPHTPPQPPAVFAGLGALPAVALQADEEEKEEEIEEAPDVARTRVRNKLDTQLGVDIAGPSKDGRPSKWDNPFVIVGRQGRQEALLTYWKWLMGERQRTLREDARHTLRGAVLLCTCPPQPCHGELLAIVADSSDDHHIALPRDYFRRILVAPDPLAITAHEREEHNRARDWERAFGHVPQANPTPSAPPLYLGPPNVPQLTMVSPGRCPEPRGPRQRPGVETAPVEHSWELYLDGMGPRPKGPLPPNVQIVSVMTNIDAKDRIRWRSFGQTIFDLAARFWSPNDLGGDFITPRGWLRPRREHTESSRKFFRLFWSDAEWLQWRRKPSSDIIVWLKESGMRSFVNVPVFMDLAILVYGHQNVACSQAIFRDMTANDALPALLNRIVGGEPTTAGVVNAARQISNNPRFQYWASHRQTLVNTVCFLQNQVMLRTLYNWASSPTGTRPPTFPSVPTIGLVRPTAGSFASGLSTVR